MVKRLQVPRAAARRHASRNTPAESASAKLWQAARRKKAEAARPRAWQQIAHHDHRGQTNAPEVGARTAAPRRGTGG